ncbi:hypothetical protein FNF28_03134 [Cafeteria roenbergensis]|uniref:SUI1 domain-containing protein n=1 Tax=Cafeteria roenbergensis TaxID=33653 RepID=A0A5A8DM29_CAFRO|nr:hypothetical protein FNF28_03134 [Cafeteria roenbergensis]
MEGPAVVALEVVYCGVCGMPTEYCEYGSTIDRCEAWRKANCPTEGGAAAAAASGAGDADDEEGGAEADEEADAKAEAEASEAAAAGATGKGAKKKVGEAKVVIQSKQVKGRKKWLTMVVGVELFDVKLKDLKKSLSSKFAASASITENAKGTKMVQVGGEVAEEAALFIVQEYGIPATRVFVLQGKKAVSAAKLEV